ncbi:MAG: DUF4824 family protein [Sneathiella sp.]|nr:DUF4824 family protein [Sneathiella sp.]
MSKLKMLAALLVLVVTNILMFSGIIWNRSGEPVDELMVTQCEFNTLTSGYRLTADLYLWLNPGSVKIKKSNPKYAELTENGTENFRNMRRYYVVLKKGYWKSKIIDGNIDLEVLRSKYSANKNTVIELGYLINRRQKDHLEWRLAHGKIFVESKFREDVEQILSQSFRARNKRKKTKSAKGACSPTHYITINWGQRGEPWINSIEPVT